MIHEIYHGLIFQGRGTFVTSGTKNLGGFTGAFTVFDTFLAVGNCTMPQLLNFNPSNRTEEVAKAFTSGKLAFWGSEETSIGLYSPSTYIPGTSVYHLNTPATGATMCMSPAIPSGLAQRTVCDAVRAIQQRVISGLQPPNDTCRGGDLANYLGTVVQPTVSPGPQLNQGETILGIPKQTFFMIVGGVAAFVVVVIAGFLVCSVGGKKKRPEAAVVVINQDGEVLSGYMSPRDPTGGYGSSRFESGRFFATPGGLGAPMGPQPGQVFVVDPSGVPVLASPGGRALSFNDSRSPSFNATRVASFNGGRTPSFNAARVASFNGQTPRAPSFNAAGPRSPSFNAGPGGAMSPPPHRAPSFNSPSGPTSPRTASFNASGAAPAVMSVSPRSSGRFSTPGPASPPQARSSGRFSSPPPPGLQVQPGPNNPGIRRVASASFDGDSGSQAPAVAARGPSLGRSGPDNGAALAPVARAPSSGPGGNGGTPMARQGSGRGQDGSFTPAMRLPSSGPGGNGGAQMVRKGSAPLVAGPESGFSPPKRVPSSGPNGNGGMPVRKGSGTPSGGPDGTFTPAMRLPSTGAGGGGAGRGGPPAARQPSFGNNQPRGPAKSPGPKPAGGPGARALSPPPNARRPQ